MSGITGCDQNGPEAPRVILKLLTQANFSGVALTNPTLPLFSSYIAYLRLI